MGFALFVKGFSSIYVLCMTIIANYFDCFVQFTNRQNDITRTVKRSSILPMKLINIILDPCYSFPCPVFIPDLLANVLGALAATIFTGLMKRTH